MFVQHVIVKNGCGKKINFRGSSFSLRPLVQARSDDGPVGDLAHGEGEALPAVPLLWTNWWLHYRNSGWFRYAFIRQLTEINFEHKLNLLLLQAKGFFMQAGLPPMVLAQVLNNAHSSLHKVSLRSGGWLTWMGMGKWTSTNFPLLASSSISNSRGWSCQRCQNITQVLS